MKFVLEVLRGMVIGLANIIPGVSGGTMMVSMGIYDTLIHCITHLFKEFKKSVMTLLPYAIGHGGGHRRVELCAEVGLCELCLAHQYAVHRADSGRLAGHSAPGEGQEKRPGGAVLFLAFFALIILMRCSRAKTP